MCHQNIKCCKSTVCSIQFIFYCLLPTTLPLTYIWSVSMRLCDNQHTQKKELFYQNIYLALFSKWAVEQWKSVFFTETLSISVTDISAICSIVVSKLATTICIALHFQTLWPNWFNFFSHLKKISVYDWKKKLMVFDNFQCCGVMINTRNKNRKQSRERDTKNRNTNKMIHNLQIPY